MAREVSPTGMSVDDMNRAVEFFSQAFGLSLYVEDNVVDLDEWRRKRAARSGDQARTG